MHRNHSARPRRRTFSIPLAIAALSIAFASRAQDAATLERVDDTGNVEFVENVNAKSVEVRVNGRHFTTYRYDQAAEPWLREKPIFYPVLTLGGAQVNRQFPMVKGIAGERTDHPHQASAYFTYGDVDGVDYWNINPASKRHIAHKSVVAEGNGLTIERDWINPDLAVVLNERTVATFGGGDDQHWMDQRIVLTAARDTKIGDSKEGAWGIRMSAKLQEQGGTGRYVNAEGLESKDVWGKTSPWVAIRGEVDNAGVAEETTLAIFSHPSTLNHPPYWHARDYGLFTVNPFGRKSYDKSQEERITTLKAGESVELRFRMVVYSGKVPNERLADDYAEFAK